MTIRIGRATTVRFSDEESLRLGTGGGAAPGPYPSPPGYAWAYVTENGVTVTESGSPVVELVRIN